MKRYLYLLSVVPLLVASYFAFAGDVGTSLADDVLRYHDFQLSSADMDTLNATVVTVIGSPGAGKVSVVDRVACFNDFNSVKFSLGGGSVDFRYTNSSGSLVARLMSDCLDTAEDSYCTAYGQDVLVRADAAIVAHASNDVTAGNGNIRCRVYYKTITASDI